MDYCWGEDLGKIKGRLGGDYADGVGLSRSNSILSRNLLFTWLGNIKVYAFGLILLTLSYFLILFNSV